MSGQLLFEMSELMKFADDCKLYSAFNPNDIEAVQAMQQDIDTFTNCVTLDLKMKLNGS